MHSEQILSQVLTFQEDIHKQENKDGTLSLLKLSLNEHFFVADGIAADICRKVDGKTNLQQIILSLGYQKSEMDETFEGQLVSLVSELKKEQIIL